MDKTQSSPSRENYEELEGLSDSEIEKRIILVQPVPLGKVLEEATNSLNKHLIGDTYD